MDENEEDYGVLDDPIEMLKSALAWVPKQYLYYGVLEMIDYLIRESDKADEGDGYGPEMTEAFNVLFNGAVKGVCSHPEQDEEPETTPPPISEDEIEKFRKMFGIQDED